MSPELRAAIDERDRLAKLIADYAVKGQEPPNDLLHAYRVAKFAIIEAVAS